MKLTFSLMLIALVALSGSQTIFAQSAWTQPRPAPANSVPAPRATPALPIIAIGSPLTFGGTNAPDTYSAATTFSPTPVLVDNGKVQIWQQQMATGSTGEWDIFYMKTVNGGPVAGDINANWNITMNFVFSQAVNFDQVVQQWMVNGTAVGPLTNGIGTICCAKASNPILPGWSYYNSGFAVPYPAGPYPSWQQIFVNPYNIVSRGGIDPSTANEFVFALHFTLQLPLPSIGAAVSASDFGDFPTFAPGSWVEIYGTNLAAATQTWATSDFNGVNGPTRLGGTTVTIGGQAAFIDYISPTQVNVQVPGGVGTGAQSLVLTTLAGSSPPFSVTLNPTQPGLLAPPNFKVGGTQYVVAQFSDGTFVMPPGAVSGIPSRRAVPGDTIVIYGIGFGLVNPNTPPGQLVGQLNSLSDTFTVSINGKAANFTYDGLAPNYMGLYQFNIVVPSTAPSDTAPFTFNLGGAAGTQTLAIAIGS